MPNLNEQVREVGRLLLKGMCTGHSALNDHGVPVHVMSIFACRFCLSGAVFRVLGSYGTGRGYLFDKVREVIGYPRDFYQLSLPKHWDSMTDTQRKAVAERLANYNGA